MFTNFSNMKGPCLEVGVCVYKFDCSWYVG